MGLEHTTIQRTSSCQCITFFWHHTNLMPIQESLTSQNRKQKRVFSFKAKFSQNDFFLKLEKKKNNKFPIFQFIRLFIFIFSLLLNKVAAESYRSFLTVENLFASIRKQKILELFIFFAFLQFQTNRDIVRLKRSVAELEDTGSIPAYFKCFFSP